MQNFAPACAGVPHFGQAAGRSDAPHSLQNLAPADHGGAALGAGLGLRLRGGWLLGGRLARLQRRRQRIAHHRAQVHAHAQADARAGQAAAA